ncbi:MAG: hypothetical protein WA843_03035 [Candidatus Saccharimonadales bacterium]
MKRICTVCKVLKPITDFNKSSKGKDGYNAQCSKCKYAKTGRKNFLENKEKCYANAAKWNKANREIVNKRTRERYAFDKSSIVERDRRHAEKKKAQHLLQTYVQRGKILKPSICSICNCESKRIEGHHADYSKPLEVIWVCSSCHHNIHKSLKERVQPERPNSQDIKNDVCDGLNTMET